MFVTMESSKHPWANLPLEVWEWKYVSLCLGRPAASRDINDWRKTQILKAQYQIQDSIDFAAWKVVLEGLYGQQGLSTAGSESFARLPRLPAALSFNAQLDPNMPQAIASPRPSLQVRAQFSELLPHDVKPSQNPD
jgi:hypothetical protein